MGTAIINLAYSMAGGKRVGTAIINLAYSMAGGKRFSIYYAASDRINDGVMIFAKYNTAIYTA